MKGVVVTDGVDWSLVFKDGKDVSVTPELSFLKKLKPPSVRTG